jgi:hypothetical protein
MPIWLGVWGKTYGWVGSGDEAVVSEWSEDYRHALMSETEAIEVF